MRLKNDFKSLSLITTIRVSSIYKKFLCCCCCFFRSCDKRKILRIIESLHLTLRFHSTFCVTIYIVQYIYWVGAKAIIFKIPLDDYSWKGFFVPSPAIPSSGLRASVYNAIYWSPTIINSGKKRFNNSVIQLKQYQECARQNQI
jgi:hypothetical protein